MKYEVKYDSSGNKFFWNISLSMKVLELCKVFFWNTNYLLKFLKRKSNEERIWLRLLMMSQLGKCPQPFKNS